MSFGTNYDSDILREEIKSVADRGILMIAAAGAAMHLLQF